MNSYIGSRYINREGEVEKVISLLGERKNTTISEEIWIKYPREWQTFLEQISDFLAVGKAIWWSQNHNSITFYDGADMPCARPEGPPLHHFRNWCIIDEEKYLSTNWKKCLDNRSVIPNSSIIKIYDDVGDFVEMMQISDGDHEEIEEEFTLEEVKTCSI